MMYFVGMLMCVVAISAKPSPYYPCAPPQQPCGSSCGTCGNGYPAYPYGQPAPAPAPQPTPQIDTLANQQYLWQYWMKKQDTPQGTYIAGTTGLPHWPIPQPQVVQGAQGLSGLPGLQTPGYTPGYMSIPQQGQQNFIPATNYGPQQFGQQPSLKF